MRNALLFVAVVALATSASATDIPLLNAGFEASGPGYTAPIPDWNGGGDFSHSDTLFTPPPELENEFGFLGSGDPWGCYQVTGVTIQEGYTYTFKSWVLIDGVGALPFGVGYDDPEFGAQVAETQIYGNTYTDWTLVDGVSWTVPAGHAGIGLPLVVGYAGNPYGLVEGNTWFDNAMASYVPEPASLLLVGLGLLLRRR